VPKQLHSGVASCLYSVSKAPVPGAILELGTAHRPGASRMDSFPEPEEGRIMNEGHIRTQGTAGTQQGLSSPTIRGMASGATVGAGLLGPDQEVKVGQEDALLVRRLVKAQELERLRLAHELHDELGQDITALSLGLKTLETFVGMPEAASRIAALQSIVKRLSIAIHGAATDLRPPQLEEVGLSGALEELVATWATRLEMRADVDLEAVSEIANEEGALVVYRVVQEALTNIAKHARARTMSVWAVRVPGFVKVVVRDDGAGFDAVVPGWMHSPSLGLLGMRERLNLIGGKLEIESKAGHGTAILASIPVPTPGSRG
jgi:signal transduction histidine kinase